MFTRLALFITAIFIGFSVIPTTAQATVNLRCGTVYDASTHLPDPFPGALYRRIEDSTGTYLFERITQAGRTTFASPFTGEEGSYVNSVPRISPNGQRIVFRGYEELAVWDMTTGEVAKLAYSDDDGEYLRIWDPGQIRGYETYLNKIVWKGDDQLTIQYFTDALAELKGSRDITILTNPLRLMSGQRQDLTFPNFALPAGNFKTYAYSPLGAYTSVMLTQAIPNEGLFQWLLVYTTNNNALAFDLPPTLSKSAVVYHPVWTRDERIFFQQIDTGLQLAAYKLTQFDLVEGNFTENTYLNQTLENFFGTDYRSGGWYPAAISNRTTQIGFALSALVNDEVGNYASTYNYVTGEVTVVCDPDNLLPGSPSPLWSPDDLYFGYVSERETRLLDPRNGDVYLFPRGDFVGWIASD